MSNAILPLALVGSMMSSVGAVAYGIQTGAIPTGKSEPEPVYTPPTPSEPADLTGGSMMVDDFVIQGDADEADITAILEESALEDSTDAHKVDGDDDQITGLAGMPINCGVVDENQTALQSFGITADKKYAYKCSSLENPGDLKFGTYLDIFPRLLFYILRRLKIYIFFLFIYYLYLNIPTKFF
jgi:hypothetical protein